MYRIPRMFMLCFLLATLSSAQAITNIRQTVENGRIVIKYDLNGIGDVDIKITARDKTGQMITPTVVAGEIQSVSAGRDHLIWWEPQLEGRALQGWTVELKAELITGAVTDIDGNVYQTVKIGDQWWMAENLKVTHYRNGDVISNITIGARWSNTTTGAYCNYKNDVNNVVTYGRLYNWYAVDDSRNIAPAGWHVPSDAEWQTLVNYLGGDAVAGGKMKETGTTHWNSPNTGATNERGFLALPGGSRYFKGRCHYIGHHGDWWSATEGGGGSAWGRDLGYDYSDVTRGRSSKQAGFSVRCVGD